MLPSSYLDYSNCNLCYLVALITISKVIDTQKKKRKIIYFFRQRQNIVVAGLMVRLQ